MFEHTFFSLGALGAAAVAVAVAAAAPPLPPPWARESRQTSNTAIRDVR